MPLKTHSKILLRTNQKAKHPLYTLFTQESGAKESPGMGALRTWPSESTWRLSFSSASAVGGESGSAKDADCLPHKITDPSAQPSARGFTAVTYGCRRVLSVPLWQG